jgi:hypothetical protein
MDIYLKNYKDEVYNEKSKIVKSKKEPKEYKEGNIMKGRTDLVKMGNKYSVDTELNVNNNMNDKVKRALIKSMIEELNKKFDDY